MAWARKTKVPPWAALHKSCCGSIVPTRCGLDGDRLRAALHLLNRDLRIVPKLFVNSRPGAFNHLSLPCPV
jgi:hypothetical protein